MNDKQLYSEILGIANPWEVTEVRIDLTTGQVEIVVRYAQDEAPCVECNTISPLYDQRETRRWRHLDTCQLKTYLVCDVPRSACTVHGIKTISVSWAEKSSRYTLLFERLAIELLLASKNQTKTGTILRTSFDTINHIMHRAVERGLCRRDHTKTITKVGIDEKSFQSGHQYVSVLSDLEQRCVLDVVKDRTEEATEILVNTALSEEQRKNSKAICMDMWKPFMNTSEKCLPQADVVHDRFHVMKYLNDAVDATRRKESKSLAEENDPVLKGSKYLFLKNPDNLSDAQRTRFQQLQALNLSTSDAWRMKENFKGFFDSTTLDEAKYFLVEWSNDVHLSAIVPMKKVAAIFQRHLKGLLNYIKHRITNSVAEGLNALIQEIKFVARGFRRFENFRVAILFFLGKLNLYPQKCR
jgi:transposase